MKKTHEAYHFKSDDDSQISVVVDRTVQPSTMRCWVDGNIFDHDLHHTMADLLRLNILLIQSYNIEPLSARDVGYPSQI